VEVLRQLLRGRRTISELVQLLFAVGPSSLDFHPYYVRTWRAVRELEARGLVSAPLLGKDKAYRLTQHGLGALLSLSEDRDKQGLGILSRTDHVVFASTIILGAATYILSRPGGLTAFFVFMLGVSTCRLISRLRSVW